MPEPTDWPVGPNANGISIADPNDRGMIDVAGCAAATPPWSRIS